MNKIEFNNLKYINLKITNNDILYKIIKNSKKLKGITLRLNNNKDISNILSLIEDLKKLKILKININNNDDDEEKILKNFPKLKEKKYSFEEFKINEKENKIECIIKGGNDKIIIMKNKIIEILIYIIIRNRNQIIILKYI